MKFLIFFLLYLCLLAIICLPTILNAVTIPPEGPESSYIQRNNLFNRIAWCESGDDPTAKNPTSSASGRFQFLWSSWNYYGKKLWGQEFYQKNIWDYNDNTELAWYVFEKNGTKDWESSRGCWDR